MRRRSDGLQRWLVGLAVVCSLIALGVTVLTSSVAIRNSNRIANVESQDRREGERRDAASCGRVNRLRAQDNASNLLSFAGYLTDAATYEAIANTSKRSTVVRLLLLADAARYRLNAALLEVTVQTDCSQLSRPGYDAPSPESIGTVLERVAKARALGVKPAVLLAARRARLR